MLCAGNAVVRIINPCFRGPYILDTTFGMILFQAEIPEEMQIYSPFVFNVLLPYGIIALIESIVFYKME